MDSKGLLKKLENTQWEVKKMEDVFVKHYFGDQKVNRSFVNNGTYPSVTCTDIFESNIYIEKHKTFVNEESLSKKTYIENGDLLVANDGYTPKKNKNGFCIYLKNNKPIAGGYMYVLKHHQNAKYLAYALNTEITLKQMSFLFTKGLSSIMRISIRDIKKIKIPIPSLEIQEKIGNFLFSFTEYEKKLQQELEKRRKQFHYYKEKLFEEVLEKSRLRS